MVKGWNPSIVGFGIYIERWPYLDHGLMCTRKHIWDSAKSPLIEECLQIKGGLHERFRCMRGSIVLYRAC